MQWTRRLPSRYARPPNTSSIATSSSSVLILDHPDPFADNWIYVHSPEQRVGRIQNFRAWSPDLVPDPSKSSIGMEYFCDAGSDLWDMSDDGPDRAGEARTGELGLARCGHVVDGTVIRQEKAYPVYDAIIANALDGNPKWIDRVREPAGGRPQRDAPLQQPGPFDAHRDAGRAKHPGRGARPVGRQRRAVLPRRVPGAVAKRADQLAARRERVRRAALATLAVVIPAYNAAATLPDCLARAWPFGTPARRDHPVR